MSRHETSTRFASALIALLVSGSEVESRCASVSLQDGVGSGTADEEKVAIEQLEELKVRVSARVRTYQEASVEERQRLSFQRDLQEIGDFIRKWQPSHPSLADAARIYMAREVLFGALGKDRDAEQLLKSVIGEAGDPFVAGMAAVHAAEILLETGAAEARIRSLRELYEGRAVFEPGISDMLRGIEVRARLRIGATFPDLEGPGLSGDTLRLSAHSEHTVVVLFFNCSHPQSLGAFREVTAQQRQLGESGLRTLCVSLDSKAETLEQELAREDRSALKGLQAVIFDGKGWQSPLASAFGIQELPTSFILDGQRKILYRNVPVDQLPTVLRDTLSGGSDKN